MIEVIIDSIRVSLMSQHRVVVLKDMSRERYLPIWIGPCEAEAITVKLQEMPAARPLTHDLLRSVISELGGRVVHILISDLRQDVYYARIVVEVAGEQIEVDSRPSDAIALAVRVSVPIFVADSVMDKAGREPDEDIEKEAAGDSLRGEKIDEKRLSAFADFVDTLDLDDLEDSEE
ncbi:MAG: bifunctional nuclease family protein [Anaerolineae bacterium]|nr:bifunctional nuclease family protein [Anaerolineae bacterium]